MLKTKESEQLPWHEIGAKLGRSSHVVETRYEASVAYQRDPVMAVGGMERAKYTKAEDRTLVRMWNEGHSRLEITRSVPGRTFRSDMSHLAVLRRESERQERLGREASQACHTGTGSRRKCRLY